MYVGKKGTKGSYPTRRWSNTSTRRPLNRYEAEGSSEGVSASAKKLKVSDEDFDINYEFAHRIATKASMRQCGICLQNLIQVARKS